MKCREPLTKVHRCNGRKVRENVYERLTDGVHYTHVISELISAVENSWPDEENKFSIKEDENEAILDTRMIEQLLENKNTSKEEKDQISTAHYLSAAFLGSSKLD